MECIWLPPVKCKKFRGRDPLPGCRFQAIAARIASPSVLVVVFLGISALTASSGLAFYGDILMNRTAKQFGVPPAVFPHWAHRLEYTCQACHPSVFRMAAGTHEIMMERMAARESFCMACHNGKVSWKPVDCARCHLIEGYPSRNREPNVVLGSFPRDGDGGGNVDWGEALRRRLIAPRPSVTGKRPERPPDLPDVLMPRTEQLPAVVFSHASHGAWLACVNCHPSPFVAKSAGNPMTMATIRAGQHCGACHGKVAFPITQCERCHRGRASK